MENGSILKTPSIFSLESLSKQFFNYTVQQFRPTHSTIQEETLLLNPNDLQRWLTAKALAQPHEPIPPMPELTFYRRVVKCCFLGIRVTNRELQVGDVKMFCELLNKLANSGVIIDYALAPLSAIRIEQPNDTVVNLLVFYPFTRLDFESLRILTESVHEEGVLPTTDYTANVYPPELTALVKDSL